MKYLSVLCLILCMVGCDLIPSVIDESIPLPAPVIIDNLDKVPAKPVPAPMPVPAPQPKVVPVEAPAPEVLPQAEPVKPAAPAAVEAKATPKATVEDKRLWPLETRWSHNSHWSYPGSTADDANRTKLRKHLAGKPHYVVTDEMTAEQVLDFHDAWHEADKNRMPLPAIKPRVKEAVRAVVAVSTLTQYTIASCGYCKTDQRDILPQWAAKGWTIKIVDETDNPRGSYPRYELRGADGSFRTHSGSLRNWK